MNRIAIVATHHKSGTVWMSHTFRRIGKALDIKTVNTVDMVGLGDAGRVPPLIFCSAPKDPERFPQFFDGEDVRIFHVIRDPRDVAISAMHYHLRSEEKWLHRADPELGGATYQASLAALKTERTRYEFEMRFATARTVKQMLDWNYARSGNFEGRYEELIRDTEGSYFLRAVTLLGFSSEEAQVCVRVFLRNAIFGGRAERKTDFAHVRSGEPEQWRHIFDRELGEAFLARYGDALVRLGYEKDDSWLESLPAARPELDRPPLP